MRYGKVDRIWLSAMAIAQSLVMSNETVFRCRRKLAMLGEISELVNIQSVLLMTTFKIIVSHTTEGLISYSVRLG